MSRLFNILWTFSFNVTRLTISSDMSYDIHWLLDFLPRFNGISIINPTKWDFDDLCITTDTCLEPRGATCLNFCFTFEFPSHILRQSLHILALELFLVVVATQVWAVILHDHCFVISGSNETAVSAINFGKSLYPFMQQCLQQLWLVAATNDFEIQAPHVAGSHNTLSDCPGRWHTSSWSGSSLRCCPHN